MTVKKSRSWRSWTLVATVAVLGSCSKTPSAPAITAPATQPAPSSASSDWPAFHGGGPLRGQAGPISGNPLVVRWTYVAAPGESDPIAAGAAIDSGFAYFGDGSGKVHAVDLKTGKAKWTYKAEDAIETTPMTYDGKVMVGDLAGTFTCLSSADGKKLWSFDAGSSIHSSANLAMDGAKARVVFGNDGATVFCLNIADGTRVWEQPAGDRVNGAPAVGFRAVFVSGCDAHLHAMKIEDGSEKFSADLGALCPGSPTLLDDRIVIGTDGGHVISFSADGAKQLWSYDQVGSQAMVYSSPAVADGVVVVGARDRDVHGIDLATGARKWIFATRGDVDSSPVISGDRVYVASKDKKLYVLNLKTGQKIGEFTAGRAITASPAIGEGVVVIGDTAGNLYCLEPK